MPRSHVRRVAIEMDKNHAFLDTRLNIQDQHLRPATKSLHGQFILNSACLDQAGASWPRKLSCLLRSTFMSYKVRGCSRIKSTKYARTHGLIAMIDILGRLPRLWLREARSRHPQAFHKAMKGSPWTQSHTLSQIRSTFKTTMQPLARSKQLSSPSGLRRR